MKILTAFLALFVLTVSADPRMEAKDDFCHMIQDADDTDKEVFVGDCEVQIYVRDYRAWGLIEVIRKAPSFLESSYFESPIDNSECVMVETNGTEYRTPNFVSETIVNNDEVTYRLECFAGMQDGEF